jgi:CheY-like chemotaxis protein
MCTILMIGNGTEFVGDARRGLQQQGHQVILVADGATGLVTAALRRPDLVILDGQDCALTLSAGTGAGNGNGCEALVRCLKNDVRTAHTPILAFKTGTRAAAPASASSNIGAAPEDAADLDALTAAVHDALLVSRDVSRA